SALEYKASVVNTDLFPDYTWQVNGINDKGQVYGVPNSPRGDRKSFYTSDSKGTISTLIENTHSNIHFSKVLVNNSGQTFGEWHNTTQTPLFLWSKSLGFHPIYMNEAIQAQITSLNDLGQIIGWYSFHGQNGSFINSAFLWDTGDLTDMGVSSEFAKHLESTGYHVMYAQLLDINNRGEIVGYLISGKYNKNKKEFVSAEKKVFFWNGLPHIIPLEKHLYDVSNARINNKGEILITANYDHFSYDGTFSVSYLWSLEDGLQPLVDFIGKKKHDSSVVLGYRNESCEDSCDLKCH
ncbi:DUF3466 family protein, partial [Chlamydiales bacterium]|nr:DUF3466 family protein [Chlamydiales bacterium]